MIALQEVARGSEVDKLEVKVKVLGKLEVGTMGGTMAKRYQFVMVQD